MNCLIRPGRTCFAGLLVYGVLCASLTQAWGSRTTVSLDGQWEIAEGGVGLAPTQFGHCVPVPGLVDEARPTFAEVGQKSPRRESFWYRRTFRVKGEVPAVAMLKLHKAAYGSRVLLNGVLLGEHLPSFTPGYFDARPALRGNGALNELVIRVGATREALPPTVASGWDYEKVRYIPGLFDSVELILSGTPNIIRVQVAPEIASQTIRVQAVVRNAGPKASTQLRFKVFEARSGRPAGEASSEQITLDEQCRANRGSAHPNPPLPAVVAGGPVSIRAGSKHRRGRLAHAIRHEGVPIGPHHRPRNAEWPPLLPARQQRNALPVL